MKCHLSIPRADFFAPKYFLFGSYGVSEDHTIRVLTPINIWFVENHREPFTGYCLGYIKKLGMFIENELYAV